MIFDLLLIGERGREGEDYGNEYMFVRHVVNCLVTDTEQRQKKDGRYMTLSFPYDHDDDKRRGKKQLVIINTVKVNHLAGF